MKGVKQTFYRLCGDLRTHPGHWWHVKLLVKEKVVHHHFWKYRWLINSPDYEGVLIATQGYPNPSPKKTFINTPTSKEGKIYDNSY